MKKIFCSVVLGLLCGGAMAQISGVVASSEGEKQLEMKEVVADAFSVPEVVAVGKEEPRAIFMSYGNRDIARDNNYALSEWYLPLSGVWDFAYFEDYRNAPINEFYKLGYDKSRWSDIKVPGNWERQGFGTPIYTNIAYEFAPVNPTPPELPEAIEVGLYSREFTVPLILRDRDVFLCFEGVKGATTVYINGKVVGYTEDSKTRAEFLINDYITDGVNNLSVEVKRWGTGNYLECQDFWRLSGFERDVFIWSQPRTRIDDYRVKASLDSTYTNGEFDIEIALKNNFIRPTGYMQVWYEIEDENQNIIDYSYAEIQMEGNSVDTLRFHRTLKNIKPWSAENPNLYSLVLKIKKDGRFIEYSSSKIGFRTTEVVGRDYLVNGKRVLIKGVNYHEHDEITGHYLSKETIKKDMELMKKANVNAIRTCHYPQSREFYELADKYGFYVVSEVNIESHGMGYDMKKGGTLANNPQWLNAHMERTVNMFERYKNFPSIVIWSLGNEAGNGYNFYKTYNYLKGVDSLRPVQYERAELEWNTDIFCPMYPRIGSIRKWAKSEDTDRPYIFCEYAHAMGNSNGDINDTWKEIYDSKTMQGGFIWDWVDQGMLEYNADTTDVTWFYGGDYLGKGGKAMPSDGNFLINGLVSADRTPHPTLLSQIKKTYQNIHFRATDLEGGKFEMINYFNFTPSSKFKIDWRIKQGGKTLTSGVIKSVAQPDGRVTFTLPAVRAKAKNGQERFLEFSVRLLEGSELLDKGYEIASEQFVLPATTPKTQYHSKVKMHVDSDSEAIMVGSTYFSLAVDRITGFLCSYNVNGQQLVADELGLRPLFWRAATDNDYGAGLPAKMAMWREPSQNLRASSVEVISSESDVVKIASEYNLPEGTALKVVYTIYGSGAVHVGCSFEGNSASDKQIPRLGMRMRLPEQFNTLEYLGRGPEENYIDRNTGTDIGLYTTLADGEAFDYARPQETGHHTDTRYLSLTKGGRIGMAVVADDVVGFNALRNSVEDFDAEGEDAQKYDYQWNNFNDNKSENPFGRYKRHTHTWDINPQPYVELCIDYKQMGVAGENSWGAVAEDKYLIKAADSAEWGFTLLPVRYKSEAAKYSNYKF